uniref:Odorant binding protein 11 n=1 Tax=Holotrichia oblita TaxID=644536 RepID=A0A3Q8SSH6_HOLOL|nr:odorant binding protein 11 [Holotrichia oblita]
MPLLCIGADDPDKEKLREAAKTIMYDCKDKVSASDADVQSLLDKTLPTTKEGACLLECIFTTSKVMKDGTLDKDATLKTLESVLKKDKDKEAKMTQVLDACQKEIGKGTDDKCQTAKMIAECLQKQGKLAGLGPAS